MEWNYLELIILSFLIIRLKLIPLLASNPYMGKIEPLLINRKGHEYRSLVIHEHFKLIYYIDLSQNILYIVDLWDTRREPSRLIVTTQK